MVPTEEESDSKSSFNYDLQSAASVQAKLIPKEVPRIPGYDLAAFYRPCKTVSGDYFDFLRLDDKRYGMLIADVSGKGVSAGFIMAQVRTYMHNNPQVLGIPYMAAVSLNDFLHNTIPPGMFVTVFYFVLHVPTGQLSCINCGHNPLVWYHAQTKEVKIIGQGGMPVGIANKQIFQEKLSETRIHMGQDDVVMQYTDGVNEAMAPNGDEFGIERTAELVRKFATQPCITMLGSLIREVYGFVGSEQLPDDATMIALKKTAAALTASTDKAPEMFVSILDASKKCGLAPDVIREGIRTGTVRSRFLDNVSDVWVVESDAVRLAQSMGGKMAVKPKVLLIAGNSNFSDIISLELKRNQKIESKQAGLSGDAVRAAQQLEPTVVLFEILQYNPKVGQVLADVKKICPQAEFMVYLDNPAFATKVPEVAELLRMLNVKHIFDKGKGSRPVLMLLSSKVTGAQ